MSTPIGFDIPGVSASMEQRSLSVCFLPLIRVSPFSPRRSSGEGGFHPPSSGEGGFHPESFAKAGKPASAKLQRGKKEKARDIKV